MKRSENRSLSMVHRFTRDYLLVSLIPVFLSFVCILIGSFLIQRYAAELIKTSVYALSEDARTQFEEIGKSVILEKARSVADQMDIFLDDKPDLTMLQVQRMERFRALAMQQVGETGYTCLYEAGTGIMRIHPNSDLIDRDMRFLSESLPSWWAIFKPTLSGNEFSGYYDWLEPNGQKRKKFMAITPINHKVDGRTLMIAATTYIDEFSAPSLFMKEKSKALIITYREYVDRLALMIGLVISVILCLTFLVVYMRARRTALRYILPIVKLSNAAKKVGESEWETEEDRTILERKDEIGELAASFYKMRLRLRELFVDLEKRLEEIKSMQAAVKRSEQYYRSLFDGVPVGLYRTTPDNRIIDANSALLKMLKYPSKELFLSRAADEMYADPKDRVRWKALVDKHAGVSVYEFRMNKYDGTLIWVENHSNAVRDGDGQILFYEGSLKDITQRKDAETALLEGERKYRVLYEEAKRAKELYLSLLRSSADAIAIYDIQGQVTYVSPAFTRLFGWELDELKGKRIPFVPDSEMKATLSIIKALVENGTPCQGFETKRFTKDGRVIDISISASRYEDHLGQPAGMLVILRDISERKRLENQLQLIQRMEAIGTLAGGIAHDFNNLMMGILGNVSLMMLEKGPADRHFKHLQNIEKLIQSGSQLTHQLLGYARKGKYELKTIDLNTVVRESAETFGRTRKEIVIYFMLHPEQLAVVCDKSQIEQVLFNLYINAADAMPRGGDLYLQTAIVNDNDMREKPFVPAPGRYVVLDVTDTGVGMDEETKNKIFDPFFTTKEMGRGTGLGLASVYGIIKAHGGYIEVVSTQGRGATFRIYLRASDKRISRLEKADADIRKGKGTVLLVDDEEMVLDVGAQMLEALGYDVFAAPSGEKALSLYTEYQSRIDLVILDLIMPELSGGDTYDAIKKVNPNVKVLLASGYSMNGHVLEVLNRGGNGFIQKPYNVEALSRKIKDVLL